MTLTELKTNASLSELLVIQATEKALQTDIMNKAIDALGEELRPVERDLTEWFRDRHYTGRDNPIKAAFDKVRARFIPA